MQAYSLIPLDKSIEKYNNIKEKVNLTDTGASYENF
jgi:hypothetical protein